MATKVGLKSSKAKSTKKSSTGLGGTNSVAKLRSQFGVTKDVFARMTGFSVRSIGSWEGKGKSEPSAPAKQRFREFQRLQKALSEVLSPDAIPVWLETPNEAFDGRTPAEVVSSGESDRIWEMIFRLRSGVPG